MEQLLAHLVGDYLLQPERIALHKIQRWSVALVHAALYTLPFLLLTSSLPALVTIAGTHAVIDRYRLARQLIAVRNIAGDPRRWRHYRAGPDAADTTPIWLAAWLEIVTDNTLHLIINHLALMYL